MLSASDLVFASAAYPAARQQGLPKVAAKRQKIRSKFCGHTSFDLIKGSTCTKKVKMIRKYIWPYIAPIFLCKSAEPVLRGLACFMVFGLVYTLADLLLGAQDPSTS